LQNVSARVQEAVHRKPTKGFFEGLPLAPVDGVMSGHELREKLRQLPELDETSGRIVPKIAFRLAAEGDEVRIVGGEKPEISRPDHAAREVPQKTRIESRRFAKTEQSWMLHRSRPGIAALAASCTMAVLSLTSPRSASNLSAIQREQ
jgi:hypothetical protein